MATKSVALVASGAWCALLMSLEPELALKVGALALVTIVALVLAKPSNQSLELVAVAEPPPVRRT